MDVKVVEARLRARMAAVGVTAADTTIAASAVYLALLHRWNQTVNLTGFDLEALADAALDRMVLEPVAAARFVRPADVVTVDIGTGGGSPAIPFMLAAPTLRAVWFEARARKAAFLREAVRVLGLRDVEVVTARFGESGCTRGLDGQVDVFTMRAVRPEGAVMNAIRTASAPDGRLVLFSVERHKASIDLWGGGPSVAIIPIHPVS